MSEAESGAMTQKETVSLILDIVRQLVTEVRPGITHLVVSLDSSFDRDLGLDSLTRVELLSRLEKTFKVSMPERVLATADTPRDLLQAVRAASPPEKGEPVFEKPDTGREKDLASPAGAATLVEVLQYHAGKHPDQVHIRLYSDDGNDRILLFVNDALLAEVYDDKYIIDGLIGFFIGSEVTPNFTIEYDYWAYWANP